MSSIDTQTVRSMISTITAREENATVEIASTARKLLTGASFSEAQMLAIGEAIAGLADRIAKLDLLLELDAAIIAYEQEHEREIRDHDRRMSDGDHFAYPAASDR